MFSARPIKVRSSPLYLDPVETYLSFNVFQGPLSNPLHIKSMRGDLAESCYLLRWSLPMVDPEHPLTHLLRGELRTWGPAWWDGKAGPERWPGSPPGTLVSFRPFPASLPSLPFCLPFHLQSIAGSKLLASGNTMNGAGGYRRSGSGYGKRQDKHHKERGFSFQFLPPPSMKIDTKHGGGGVCVKMSLLTPQVCLNRSHFHLFIRHDKPRAF